ncbi:hypothetical protein MS2017_1082 [Bathymodiolus thermophilus thioautotrophic gill symbiont]|uniref:Lipoprotein n=1 Tax=Bathymodiolus thermophilus thioautotrophic gill symbiont TaxID=2360 RepID=A0A3G3IM31_9GAMM|nr:hypothetical protein [Bathymodiolus thermophilus thioautotrophic gill symbiont]AYQ56789.1 hypothetical protein MS2017_1082 [Bathymodiolus thermophilus thioautotrophic gill symbiont]
MKKLTKSIVILMSLMSLTGCGSSGGSAEDADQAGDVNQTISAAVKESVNAEKAFKEVEAQIVIVNSIDLDTLTKGSNNQEATARNAFNEATRQTILANDAQESANTFAITAETASNEALDDSDLKAQATVERQAATVANASYVKAVAGAKKVKVVYYNIFTTIRKLTAGDQWLITKDKAATATTAETEASVATSKTAATTAFSNAKTAWEEATTAFNKVEVAYTEANTLLTKENGDANDEAYSVARSNVSATKDYYEKDEGEEAKKGAKHWVAKAKQSMDAAKISADNFPLVSDSERHKNTAVTARNNAKVAYDAAVTATTAALSSTVMAFVVEKQTVVNGLVADAKTAKDNALTAALSANTAKNNDLDDQYVTAANQAATEATKFWNDTKGKLEEIANHLLYLDKPQALNDAKAASEEAAVKNFSFTTISTQQGAIDAANATTVKAAETKRAANLVPAGVHKNDANAYVINAYTSAAHAWAKIAEMQRDIARFASVKAATYKDTVRATTNATEARNRTDNSVDTNGINSNVKHFTGVTVNAKLIAGLAKTNAANAYTDSAGYGVREGIKAWKTSAASAYFNNTNENTTAYTEKAKDAYTQADTYAKNLESAQSTAVKKEAQYNDAHTAQIAIKANKWIFLYQERARNLTKLLFALYNKKNPAAGTPIVTYVPTPGGTNDCGFLFTRNPPLAAGEERDFHTQQMAQELSKDEGRKFSITREPCGEIKISLTAEQKAVIATIVSEDSNDTLKTFVVEDRTNVDSAESDIAFSSKIVRILNAGLTSGANVVVAADLDILKCSQQVFMLHSGWENGITEASDLKPFTYICGVHDRDGKVTASFTDGSVTTQGTGIDYENNKSSGVNP